MLSPQTVKIGRNIYKAFRFISGFAKGIDHLAKAIYVLAASIAFAAAVGLLDVLASHPRIILLPVAIVFVALLGFLIDLLGEWANSFFVNWQREVSVLLVGLAVAALAIKLLLDYRADVWKHYHKLYVPNYHGQIPGMLAVMFLVGCALFTVALFFLVPEMIEIWNRRGKA